MSPESPQQQLSLSSSGLTGNPSPARARTLTPVSASNAAGGDASAGVDAAAVPAVPSTTNQNRPQLTVAAAAATTTTTTTTTTSSASASASSALHPELQQRLGYVAGEYACSYRNLNGTLHAGSKALYFVGTYFWFDRKVMVPWDEIRKVVKMDHGLLIQCANDVSHEFVGWHFPDLNKVWLLFLSLHNDAIMGRPPREATAPLSTPTNNAPDAAAAAAAPTPRGSGSSGSGGGTSHALRRRQSDPLLTSMIRMLDDSLVQDDLPIDGSALQATGSHDSSGGAYSSLTGESSDSATVSRRPQQQPPPPPPPIGESFIWSTAGLDMEEVERLAGKLSLQPIPCTYEGIKGKLYAGKAAVYFFGRKIFWDKKEVFLQWENIRQIQMVDALSTSGGAAEGDNDENDDDPLNSSSVSVVCVGIHVVTKDDDTVHRFLKMEQADRVWATLVALHNDNLTARWEDRQQQHQRRSSRSSLRRLNSDPNLAGLTPRSHPESPTEPHKPAASSTAAPPATPVRVVEPVAPPAKPTDPAADWKDLQATPALSYVVVQEHVLPCSLDRAFQLFFQNDAEHSLAKFLESRGDSNLRSSPWQASSSSGGGAVSTTSRIVHYTHPVNAPLAPPTATARKEQTYRRFGDLGMCVWTKTFVDDVPMADCFYVSDRIRVQALEQNKVKVTMDFELTFVKSTLFKGIISKTTSSEVTALLQSFAKYMSTALGEATAEPTPALQPTAIAAAAPPPPGLGEILLQSHAGLWLLVAIVVLQLWVLGELREVKRALRQLHEQQYKMLGNVEDGGTCAGPM